MKKLGIILIAAAAVLPAATWTGVVTDTMCGAGHAMMKITPDEKCVRECVKMGGGSRFKYGLLVGKDVYTLSDQKKADAFAAKKVKVTGTLDAKTKTIQVQSIASAR